MAQLTQRTLADTPQEHVDDHNQLHAKANYVFDVTDFGAVGDSVTDDIGSITAAIAAAESASPVGTVFFPRRSFYVSSSVIATLCHIDCEADAELTTDREIAALVVGGAGTDSTANRRFILPNVTQSSVVWTATGTSSPMTGTLGSDVGVLIRNVSDAYFQFQTIRNFSYGIDINPGRDFSYNTLMLSNVVNNAVGLKIDPLTTGWVNQNTFIGGRIGLDTTAYAPVSNTVGLLFTGTIGGVSAPNGNTFIGTALESNNFEHSLQTFWSIDNTLTSIRLEGAISVDFNQLDSTHNTTRTVLESLQGAPTVTESANSTNNRVGNRVGYSGQESGSWIQGLSNATSSSNPIWTAFEATNTPIEAADIDKWTTGLGSTWLWGKQSNDVNTVSRFKINMQTGTIYLGTGEIQIRWCFGTPDGAVTAPVGSLCLRSDGSAGATLYVKETGAGNTGWVAK